MTASATQSALVLSAGLYGVAALALFGHALLSSVRAGRAVCAWRDRRVLPLLLVPFAVHGLVVLGLAQARGLDTVVLLALHGLALSATVFWTAALLLRHTVVVTEAGLWPRVGRGAPFVPWRRVTDYAEHPGHTSRLTFFHTDAKGVRGRFDLAVPRAHRARLLQVVGACVDARFEVATREPRGRRTWHLEEGE